MKALAVLLTFEIALIAAMFAVVVFCASWIGSATSLAGLIVGTIAVGIYTRKIYSHD